MSVTEMTPPLLYQFNQIAIVHPNVLVSQPVAEIDPVDHQRVPFMAVDTSDLLYDIFDIAMAPVLSLDGRD